jgi:crotonobetainyl-CoA:carnitine CoA-transferase CaiB-like acyl-CoA transferase
MAAPEGPTGSPGAETPSRDQLPFAQPSPKLPLAGVRIIDAGTMVSAPFAAVLLGDFGADVIKVEQPGVGDGVRKLAPFKFAENGAGETIPLWWKNSARNKRCVTLNFREKEAIAVFKDLAATADVVIENYRPGTFERWGLGFEELRKVNPRIIMLRISGYGQTGPLKNRAGFGRVAEAVGGLTNLIGEPEPGPPMTPGIPLGDLITGLMGAWATMMALYYRDARGGEGQVIDLGLYESIFRLLEFDPIQYDHAVDDPTRNASRIHTREGNQLSYVAPSNMFKSRDGYWITLAASNQNIFKDLAKAIGREDLLADPRFVDNPARVRHRGEINTILADWISERTLEEIQAVFDPPELPYAPILNMEDIFRHPQYLAREMLVRVRDAQLGDAVVQNVIPKFSTTPGEIRHLGPTLGEHNEEIYGGLLGYSTERLQALRDAGVI